MLFKKVFQLTTVNFKYNPDLLMFRIKQDSDQKEKDEYVNTKYGQKVGWEKPKSKKKNRNEMVKKGAKQILADSA